MLPSRHAPASRRGGPPADLGAAARPRPLAAAARRSSTPRRIAAAERSASDSGPAGSHETDYVVIGGGIGGACGRRRLRPPRRRPHPLSSCAPGARVAQPRPNARPPTPPSAHAGLSCGGLLAKYNGGGVSVLESHAIPGGAAHAWVRDGYHFESGPSLYSGMDARGPAANPLSHVLQALGEPLDLIRYDAWNVVLPEGTFLTRVGADNFADLLAQLRGPAAVEEWRALQLKMRPLAAAATVVPPLAIRWDLGAAVTAVGRYLPAILASGPAAMALTGAQRARGGGAGRRLAAPAAPPRPLGPHASNAHLPRPPPPPSLTGRPFLERHERREGPLHPQLAGPGTLCGGGGGGRLPAALAREGEGAGAAEWLGGSGARSLPAFITPTLPTLPTLPTRPTLPTLPNRSPRRSSASCCPACRRGAPLRLRSHLCSTSGASPLLLFGKGEEAAAVREVAAVEQAAQIRMRASALMTPLPLPLPSPPSPFGGRYKPDCCLEFPRGGSQAMVEALARGAAPRAAACSPPATPCCGCCCCCARARSAAADSSADRAKPQVWSSTAGGCTPAATWSAS